MLYILLGEIAEFIKYFLVHKVFFGARKNENVKLRIAGMICMIGYLVIRIVLLSPEYTMVCNIVIFVTMGLIYQGNIKNKIMSFPLTWCGINIFDFTINLLFCFTKNITPFNDFSTNYRKENVYIGAILIPVLLLILLAQRSKIKKHWLESKIDYLQYCLLLIGLFGYYVFALCIGIFLFNEADMLNMNRFYICILLSLSCIAVSITSLFLRGRYQEKQNAMQAENLALYKKQSEMQMNFYKEMQRKNEDLRRFKHDYHHHLTTMYMMMDNENYKDLKEYMYRLNARTQECTTYKFYTGNDVVDAVINGIIMPVENCDIYFECKGKLPQELNIENTDLCGLLANALENAVEACKKGMDKREIYLTISLYQNIMNIEVRNTFSKQILYEKGTIKTTKKEAGHGYGMKNMSAIVNKYNGTLNFYDKENFFYLDVNLQLTKNDNL